MKVLIKCAGILLSLFILSGVLSYASADEMFVSFEYDFESEDIGSKITIGSEPKKWTSSATGEESPILVSELEGNKVMRLSRAATAEDKGYPRIERKQDVSANCTLEVEFDVIATNGTFSLELRDSIASTKILTLSKGKCTNNSKIKLRSSVFSRVKLLIAFKSGVYTIWIDDAIAVASKKYRNDLDISKPLNFRFNTSLDPGEEIFIDNVKFLISDQELVDDGTVKLDKIFANASVPIVPLLKKSHPRMMVNDFEPLKIKVKGDKMNAEWYEALKRSADNILERSVYPYKVEMPVNHILTTARNIMHLTYTLAFVYKIENDDRYKDRLYKELENAANYPSWHPNQFLCTAELGHAFGIAYDWLYNDFTEEQLTVLRNAMLEKLIAPGISNYNGSKTGGTDFVNATHNWNLVCNGGLIIAANAIADEVPEVAEFIFDRARQSLPKAIAPYYPQGAYPEGPGYWAYGTNYLTYMMAALETSVPKEIMPSEYIFYKNKGLSETPYYQIYLNAMVGKFNYGDGGEEIGGTPIFYWYSSIFNRPEYAWYQMSMDKQIDNSVLRDCWGNVLKIIWYDPDNAEIDNSFPLDKAFVAEHGPNLVTLRNTWQDKNGIFMGLQGGYNLDNHMYLSLGTFLLEAEGERWSTMRGYGDYDWPDYFSRTGKRWQYYTTRAEGQNTLVINTSDNAKQGYPDQNIEAVAKVVDFDYSDDEAFGVLDLTTAYSPHVKSARRGIRLYDNRTKVILQDEVKAYSDIKQGYWFMHTDANMVISDDGKSVMLLKNNKRVFARMIAAPESAKFTIIKAEALQTSPHPEVEKSIDYGKKLAIDISGNKDFKLAIEFIPLKGNEIIPPVPQDVPDMKSWKAVKKDHDILANEMNGAAALFVGSPKCYTAISASHTGADEKEIIPFIENETVLVPLRFAAESFGAKVTWDENEQIATVHYKDKSIRIRTDKKVMYDDSLRVDLDSPARLVDGTIFVPLNAIAEAMDKNVFLNERGLIIISGNEREFDIDNDSEIIEKLTDILGYNLKVDDRDVEFFDAGINDYDVYIPKTQAEPPVISITAYNSNEKAIITDSTDITGKAVFRFPESKKDNEYTIQYHYDPYTFAAGPKALNSITVGLIGEETVQMPEGEQFMKFSVTASGGDVNPPENAVDNDIKTAWTAEGKQWIQADLGSETVVNSMALAVFDGMKRAYSFDILASNDGVTWEEVLTNQTTSGSTNFPEVYSLGNIKARYIRYLGDGNSTNKWNNITEIRYYKDEEQMNEDKKTWLKTFAIYPTFQYKVGDTPVFDIEGVANDGGVSDITEAQIIYKAADESITEISEGGIVNVKSKGLTEVDITVISHGLQKSARIVISGE